MLEVDAGSRISVGITIAAVLYFVCVYVRIRINAAARC